MAEGQFCVEEMAIGRIELFVACLVEEISRFLEKAVLCSQRTTGPLDNCSIAGLARNSLKAFVRAFSATLQRIFSAI